MTLKLLNNMKKIGLLILIFVASIACKSELTNVERSAYEKKGLEITQEAFQELSSQLMAQMKAGGPEAALPFCNVQALPLTSKIAVKNDVDIKRTSDKLRNLKNTPTAQGLDQLSNYLNDLGSGNEMSPIVRLDESGTIHYYAPILIIEKCLVCHGQPGESMSVKTDSIIKSYYPNDAATGYSVGDLRGMWDVTFKK